ncbi:MAG: nucleotide exchange factor GrpE [Prevotella sp.]|nr:nucleotide exchange factor GrpE [Prevotella sp.]
MEENTNIYENETLDKEPLNDESKDTTAETDAENIEKAAENNSEEPGNEEIDPLEAANKTIEELKDKYLRTAAEFDNYRKRTLKEKTELILNGGEKTISAILPVLDDMERAIENGAKTEEPEVLREGMKLIFTKFRKTLESLGVSIIDTENADFNTDVHEAIAMVPGMGDEKKGKVLDCVQTGYKLNDKVIRHAKVAVGQ